MVESWLPVFTPLHKFGKDQRKKEILCSEDGCTNKDYGDRDALGLWSELVWKLPEFYKDIDVKPALLHGDLCEVIYNPGSFYGHDEYELAISMMFGGFSSAFFDAYHQLISKQPGFVDRHELYTLFHYANHWNHFGSGTSYRDSTISVMKNLTR